MGRTDLDDDDDLAQLLLAAEQDDELAPVASSAASRPSANPSANPSTPRSALRESNAFIADLQNGTADDEPAAASVTSTPSRRANGFSAAANRSARLAESEAAGDNATSIIASTTDALDSSDDEDVSNFLNRKYNEYGRNINTMLKKSDEAAHDRHVDRDVAQSLRSGGPTQPKEHAFPVYGGSSSARAAASPKPAPVAFAAEINVFTDPIFGLRIVRPLISSSALQERMTGRTPVTVTGLAGHLARGDRTQDWALAGVIVQKSGMMTSKKGSQYVLWKLSDLRPDMKQVSVFLFKSACKDLWKTAQGMVVAMLNPGVMDGDKDGEPTLSLDTAQKCMILGQTKDLGVCKAQKRNGDPCTSIVNKSACEYCVFHVKQEYGKMSGRVELQSATSGRGLEGLRNKVLGKSEVFYGGQSWSAVPAKKNAKLTAKDQQRIRTLSEHYQAPGDATLTVRSPSGRPAGASRLASTIDANVQQRQRDLERLRQLEAENARFAKAAEPAVPTPVPKTPVVPEKFRNAHMQFSALAKPKLNSEGFSLDAGHSPSLSLRQAEANKAKALAVLRLKPLPKSNPNFERHRGTEQGRKRAAEELAARDPAQLKKQKISDEAERFRQERIASIVNAKSSHADLVEAKQNDAQTQYFDRMEKKEAMEEKMLSTFSMPCKAVTCLRCKYTAFSASDRCKAERHQLKVVDAEKRFFECKDCGHRTATVHRMPKETCKNCQGSRWQRAAMIKDRMTAKMGESLSIRGDEEQFIGSAVSGGNLNLCVAPDD